MAVGYDHYIWWGTIIQNFSKIRFVVSKELRPQKRDGRTHGRRQLLSPSVALRRGGGQKWNGTQG